MNFDNAAPDTRGSADTRQQYAHHYKQLMTTIRRADKTTINYIFTKWVAEHAEELFP